MIGATAAALAGLVLAIAGDDATAVRDDLGRPVALAAPARRIVTLAPHATELALAAGAADRLVGIAPGGDAPAALRRLPRIGGPGALDREALLALRPHLVIAWQTGNRAADLDWIQASGIAVYRSEPRSLADIAAAIRAIGRLTGREVTATRAAAAFERGLQTPCAGLPRLPIYVVIWDRPPMSVGGRHWLNALLHSAGYRNTFEAVGRGVFRVAAEAVLARGGLPRLDLVRKSDPASADRLAEMASRPGPGLAEAARLLCRRRLQADENPHP